MMKNNVNSDAAGFIAASDAPNLSGSKCMGLAWILARVQQS